MRRLSPKAPWAVCWNMVMTRAFNVAKRVRSETGIGHMAVSVSYAAVELARSIFGSLKGRTVLIVGSGKMGELAAKHLRRSGATRILVTNRTWERAEEMAKLFEGRAVEYTQFHSILHEVDIVITSSGAPHFIITKDDMQRVIAKRKYRQMFLIDIAVPRNVEPSVNEIEGVFLKDVDDLEGVVDANLQERGKQAEQAEAIVRHEVEQMIARLRIVEITPTIVSLQEQLEEIRAAEVTRRSSDAWATHGAAGTDRADDEVADQQDRPWPDFGAPAQCGPARRRRGDRGDPQGLPPAIAGSQR